MSNFKLKIAPKFIGAAALMYVDTIRVLLEYIDNALDNAQEHFYNMATNSYTKLIHIKISFKATSYKDAIFIIEDNCKGMPDITKITNSLGNSDKAGNDLLNGRFGFGAHSYLAICNKMQIYTKIADSNEVHSITLNSEMFDKATIEEVELGTIKKEIVRNNRSFTIVKLSGFYKERFKDISIDVLKSEIEKHFENTLRHNNPKITIIYNNLPPLECKPFEYNQFTGAEFKRDLNTLYYMYNKRLRMEREIDISEHPVRIYLKVINDKAINRKPVFINNGRRIMEITDLKSFRTISKGDIWGHPNLTGYIDVTGCLKPIISRNEFESNEYLKPLFYTLQKIEPELKELIKDSLGRVIDNKFKKLESILNAALNDVAKIDDLNGQDNISDNGTAKTDTDLFEGEDKVKRFVITQSDEDTSQAILENGINRRGPNRFDNKKTASVNKSFIDVQVKTNPSFRKHRNQPNISFGLNIRIDNDNEPTKDSKDKPFRSLLIGNEVIIYRRHPEFDNRLDNTIHGIPRITPSLITYLSAEILLHYKCLALNDSGRKLDNKELILDFTEGLYLLESKLAHIRNKKISDFT